MNFQGQGRPLSDEGMDQVCSTLGVSEPEVWAVVTVETRGFGFLQDRTPICSLLPGRLESSMSFKLKLSADRRTVSRFSARRPGGNRSRLRKGGEGWGEEARFVEIPLSPALSPLVPRGGRGNLCGYQWGPAGGQEAT